MQIEKIKSIDPENDLMELSGLQKKESKQFSMKDSMVNKDKDSIGSDNMPTQQRFWGKSRVDEAGKIIKNF